MHHLLAPYPFCCLNILIETRLSAENASLLLFTLIASTNVTFDRTTAVGYVTPYWQQKYFVITIQLLITLLRNNIFNEIL